MHEGGTGASRGEKRKYIVVYAEEASGGQVVVLDLTGAIIKVSQSHILNVEWLLRAMK